MRLEGYDYSSAGAYFATICNWQRQLRFGDIQQSYMHLNALGIIAQSELAGLAENWPHVSLNTFIVMPNHMHFVVMIDSSISGVAVDNLTPTLGTIVGNLKAGISRRARANQIMSSTEILWQRGYHDHIIRDEKDYYRIQEYIENNPAQWAADAFYASEG